MNQSAASLRIGLAIGAGTGPELTDVFRRTATALAEVNGLTLELEAVPHRFRTFASASENGALDVERAMQEDATIYEAFLRDFRRRGGCVVFRTAFNAPSLYRVRERLMAVKVEVLPLTSGEILLVRDATQGFYAGENIVNETGDEIQHICSFRRSNTHRVLRFALAEAVSRYGSIAVLDHAVVVCKVHLLGPQFEQWVTDFSREAGISFQVLQPDTTNRQLLRGALDGRTLLVGANEWADVMQPDLMARYGLGTQEERCSRTVYLDDDVMGLEEVQTAHGSADDLTGRGTVNPIATLRAAALAIERFGGRGGVVNIMEEAITSAARNGLRTPDAGGTSPTAVVVDHVLGRLASGTPSHVGVV